MLPPVIALTWPFNLTLVFAVLLGVLAFGLVRPFNARRAILAGTFGLVLGFIATYFNMYPGSIRGLLALIAVALFVSGMKWGGRLLEQAEPLIPRATWIAVGIGVVLLAASLFPYTKAGADSVDEPIYLGLQRNQITDAAPALPSPSDVRVVPWDLAAQIIARGLGEGGEASFLQTDTTTVMRHTYPDTVNGEFIWVHGPVPQTSKWVFGGQTANKVVYVRNNQSDLASKTVNGTLYVHPEGRFWDDRVERYAMEHGEFRWVLQESALQLNNESVPHWLGYLVRIDIKNQPHLERLLVINAYTGEEKDYAIGEVVANEPWIELVYPESYVYYWAQYWGANREGIIHRWFNGEGLLEPDDVTVRYIVLEGRTYWLLPMRQLAAPNLGGYILTDTQTGETRFFNRFAENLIDYDTAAVQVGALLRSGEAARQLGETAAQIGYTVDEGYLYPIRMADNTTRDAWVFPLLKGRTVDAFAIIDAQHFDKQTAFGYDIATAVERFRQTLKGAAPPPPLATGTIEGTFELIEGIRVSDAELVLNLNGTWYEVTRPQLNAGNRTDGDFEFREALIAIDRARGEDPVEIMVGIASGRIVDLTLPGVSWRQGP